MMFRSALAFSVFLLGMGMPFPDHGLLTAQEQQAQPSPPQGSGEKQPDPFKPEAPETKPAPPESDVPPPKETPDVEKAAPDLSGFDRIDAYQKKWGQLNEFLRKVEGDLTEATPDLPDEDRTSPVVEETRRLMRVLDRAMLREARQIYEQAVNAENPETRNQLLRRLVELETITPLSDVTARAIDLLNSLTINGKIYPTLEEAREAERKLKAEQAKEIEGIDDQYRPQLEDLKKEQLTEDVLEAAKRLRESDAREIFETAVRLVVPQRRERLHQLIEQYPGTQAAAEAQAILAGIDRRDELIAGHKLQKALCAPVIFDQRWRRLKELLRDYPKTNAAIEAEQIFLQHAVKVPPMTIINQTLDEVNITVDVPYEKAIIAELSPGELQSFSSVFPMMVRVEVDENEWDVYQALAGFSYILEPCHDRKTILVPAPKTHPLPPLLHESIMPPAPRVSPTPADSPMEPAPMISPMPEQDMVRTP